MKNPIRPGQKQAQKSKDASQLPVSSEKDVRAFLTKVAAMPKSSGEARLIFSLDATASRQATWDAASQLQTEMFFSTQTLSRLNVQLCYFRGFGEFFSSNWQSDAEDIVRIMSGIHCEAGITQLERLLRHAIKENDRQKIKGVVYIGDAFFTFPPTMAQGASQAIESANEIFNLIKDNHSDIQNVYFNNRAERTNLISKRSKFNYFGFHISNPLLKIFRNKVLKILVKNKNFINSYLGKVYK